MTRLNVFVLELIHRTLEFSTSTLDKLDELELNFNSELNFLLHWRCAWCCRGVANILTVNFTLCRKSPVKIEAFPRLCVENFSFGLFFKEVLSNATDLYCDGMT